MPTPTTAPLDLRTEAPVGMRLLTLDDVSASPEVPDDVREVDPSRIPLFENPDPRGPCGAHVDQPDLAGALSVAFEADGPPPLMIIEVIVRPGDQEASRLLKELRADVRPQCPDFESDTHLSVSQTTRFLYEVKLPSLGDRRLASQSLANLEGQEPSFVGQVVIQIGARVVMVTVMSPERISDDLLYRLAVRAHDGARGL